MQCDDIKDYISPYLDNELETHISVQIEKHLEGCGNCRKYFSSQHCLEQSIKAHLVSDDDTQAQWDRALDKFNQKQNPLKRWGALAASLCAVLLIALVVYRAQILPKDINLAAIKNHNKYLSDQLPLNYFSKIPKDVERYFSEKLSYPVSLPLAFTVDNVRFVGARLCHLKEEPVAFLVYSIDNNPVSVFISDELQASDTDKDQLISRAYDNRSVVTLLTPDRTVIAVSKAPIDDIQMFMKSFSN